MRTSQITIFDKDIINLFSFLYKDIEIIRKDMKLLIRKDNKNVAIIKLNEYNSIIGLQLQRRYGYLNEYILRQLLGLVYKGKGDENDKLSKEV